MIQIALSFFSATAGEENISPTNDILEQCMAWIESFSPHMATMISKTFFFSFHNFVVRQYEPVPVKQTHKNEILAMIDTLPMMTEQFNIEREN